MALVPIISQTWDTTSIFNPTRMNNIEQNLAIVSDATGVKYSNGVSVKDKIDDLDISKVSIPTSLDGGNVSATSTREFLVKLADKIKALNTGRYVFRYAYSGNWNCFVVASVITKNSDAQFMVVPFGVNKIYIAYVASGSTYYCGESPAFTTLT